MATRTVVGLIGLAVVLGAAYWSATSFALLALVAILIGGIEFYLMLKAGGFHPQPVLGLLWTIAIGLNGWFPATLPLDLVLTAGFIVILSASLWTHEKPLHHFLATSATAIYLGIMIDQIISLRMLEQGFWWLLLGFAITWSNDTIAYFIGVTLGRHKIWPRLSPKKTWEGTMAGWIGTALITVLIAWFSPLDIPLYIVLALGFTGAILGFLGDLSISMVKRQVGAKDSGHFFPGHGGMLDRLDSLLFVLPFVYQVARFLS